MEEHYVKIIESAVVVTLYLIFRQVFSVLVRKHLLKRFIHETRGVAVKKIIRLVLLIVALVFILLIWGVKQADLALFAGSVLTIVGVAFVAQWSLLSNITASIILFFSHSVKLNDHIIILEGKDYAIEGKVKDIGLFFITIETKEGDEISLPNNIFIAKSIKVISNEPGESPSKDE